MRNAPWTWTSRYSDIIAIVRHILNIYKVVAAQQWENIETAVNPGKEFQNLKQNVLEFHGFVVFKTVRGYACHLLYIYRFDGPLNVV